MLPPAPPPPPPPPYVFVWPLWMTAAAAAASALLLTATLGPPVVRFVVPRWFAWRAVAEVHGAVEAKVCPAPIEF